MRQIAAVAGIASLLTGKALAQSPVSGGGTQPPAPPVAGRAPAPVTEAQAPAAKGGDAGDLSRQATDPTASLMAFNLINDYNMKITFTVTLLAPAK